MQSLSARIALPLIVIMSAAAATPAYANHVGPDHGPYLMDICAYYCSKPSKSSACFGLAIYLIADPPGGLGCTGKEKQETCVKPSVSAAAKGCKQKQEPCASAIKHVQWLCPAPHERGEAATYEVCSEQWKKLCYGIVGKKPPQPPARAKQKAPAGSAGAKTAVKCPPHMTPTARGTCVPKLDMPGFDTSPGSTPGAGRASPVGAAGGGTPAGRR